VEIDRHTATVGEEVTVEAEVQNSGGDGTYTVQFTVNDTKIETSKVDIESGETRTVTFTRQLSNPGTYEFSLNGRALGTTNVTAATSTPTPSPQENNTGTATTSDRSTPAQTTTDPAPATTESADQSPKTTTETSGIVGRSGSGFGAPAVLSALAILVSGLLLYRRKR
jgi:hypothetical protein